MTINTDLEAAIAAMPLIDHHVHSILTDPMSEPDFLSCLTEGDHPVSRSDVFDSPLGFALRHYCSPVLGLKPFATADEYLRARQAIGFDAATGRLLRASGIRSYCIDGGFQPELLLPVERMMDLAGAISHPIARLETIAEAVMSESSSGGDFLERLDVVLESARASSIGWKSVAAYRTGLALDPEKPSLAEATAAATAWFSSGTPGKATRLTDPVIVRHLLWWALERGDVLQVHAGFGNTNLMLNIANPAHMQRFIAAVQPTGGRIVFLHCYPFIRETTVLANIYPHVYYDVGLTLNYLGANAAAATRESLDMAPFHKLLFSSDAWGLPELVYLGARLWRDTTAEVLSDYVHAHGWPVEEATRVAEMIAWRNAADLYGVPLP